MPIDPSIALQSRAPSSDSMMNAMQTGMQMKMYKNKLAAAEAEQSRMGALRNYMRTHSLDTPEGRAGVNAFDPTGETYKNLESAYASRQSGGKTEDERAAANYNEVRNTVTGLLFMKDASGQRVPPTKEMVGQQLAMAKQRGLIRPEVADTMLATMPDDPNQIEVRLSRFLAEGLTPEQKNTMYNPKLEMADLGGTKQPYDPYTGKPVGSGMKVSLSPAEKARLDAETETGNYSEDSKNLMAALVAQGFPLPIPLGRGSASDALKNDIYERAGRISQGLSPSGKPAPTPAPKPGAAPSVAPATAPAASAVDVAATIGGARQDQAAVQNAIKYYSGGGRGQQQITSLNTAVAHLDTLTDLSTALANNDVKLINRAAQAWKEQTGQAAPVTFDAAKQIVAAEIIKAIVANGGTGTERQEAAEKISRANSPEQLAGVIAGFQELLAGQLDSIGAQYKATTRRNDFDTRLSDRTKRVLGRGKGADDVAQVKTDADFDKLPSGTLFVGPDGKQRRKP